MFLSKKVVSVDLVTHSDVSLNVGLEFEIGVADFQQDFNSEIRSFKESKPVFSIPIEVLFGLYTHTNLKGMFSVSKSGVVSFLIKLDSAICNFVFNDAVFSVEGGKAKLKSDEIEMGTPLFVRLSCDKLESGTYFLRFSKEATSSSLKDVSSDLDAVLVGYKQCQTLINDLLNEPRYGSIIKEYKTRLECARKSAQQKVTKYSTKEYKKKNLEQKEFQPIWTECVELMWYVQDLTRTVEDSFKQILAPPTKTIALEVIPSPVSDLSSTIDTPTNTGSTSKAKKKKKKKRKKKTSTVSEFQSSYPELMSHKTPYTLFRSKETGVFLNSKGQTYSLAKMDGLIVFFIANLITELNTPSGKEKSLDETSSYESRFLDMFLMILSSYLQCEDLYLKNSSELSDWVHLYFDIYKYFKENKESQNFKDVHLWEKYVETIEGSLTQNNKKRMERISPLISACLNLFKVDLSSLSWVDSVSMECPELIFPATKTNPPYRFQIKKTAVRVLIGGERKPLSVIDSKIEECFSSIKGRLIHKFQSAVAKAIPQYTPETTMDNYSYELLGLCSFYAKDKDCLDRSVIRRRVFLNSVNVSFENECLPVFFNVCASFFRFIKDHSFDSFSEIDKKWIGVYMSVYQFLKHLLEFQRPDSDAFTRNENWLNFIQDQCSFLHELDHSEKAVSLLATLDHILRPYWLILGLRIRLSSELAFKVNSREILGDAFFFSGWDVDIKHMQIRKGEEDYNSLDTYMAHYLSDATQLLATFVKRGCIKSEWDSGKVNLEMFSKFYLLLDFLNSKKGLFAKDVQIALLYVQSQRFQCNDILSKVSSNIMIFDSDDTGTYLTSEKLTSIFPETADKFKSVLASLCYISTRLNHPSSSLSLV